MGKHIFSKAKCLMVFNSVTMNSEMDNMVRKNAIRNDICQFDLS